MIRESGGREVQEEEVQERAYISYSWLIPSQGSSSAIDQPTILGISVV